jgi:hypothetical protein
MIEEAIKVKMVDECNARDITPPFSTSSLPHEVKLEEKIETLQSTDESVEIMEDDSPVGIIDEKWDDSMVISFTPSPSISTSGCVDDSSFHSTPFISTTPPPEITTIPVVNVSVGEGSDPKETVIWPRISVPPEVSVKSGMERREATDES